MSVGRLAATLGPFMTDADWVQDFLFFDGAPGTPLSWSGCEGSIAFVRRGLPSSRFALSSENGGLVLLSNGLGIRLAAADMAARVPGTYDFELRRHEADGDVVALLLGSVTIAAGLSAGAPPAGGGAVPGGSGGIVQVTLSPSAPGVVVVPAGGPTAAMLAALALGGFVTADGAPTGAVPAHALRLALAGQDRLQAVLGELAADPADAATIRWTTGAPVTPGDPLAAFIAAALDYSDAEMDDLFEFARAQL